MAENQDGAEKSEQPSSRRLDEARRKGQVPLTREFPPLVVLIGGVSLLSAGAPSALWHLQQYQRHWFDRVGTMHVTPEILHGLLQEITEDLFLPILPFGVAVAVLAVASLVLQTGPLWVEEALKPKPEKLNPKNGLKRIVSLKGVVELVKSLFKVGVVGILVYAIVSAGLPRMLSFPYLSLVDAFAGLWDLVWKLVMSVGGAFLLLALLDYLYQRWQYMEDMKMTKQEVQDETKSSEGDPQMRSRRMSVQRERARQRMLQAVPKADVVITNPTHLAVALRYETGKMDAPVMVAKGAGFLAEKIKQIARHSGVPIVENKSLARGLFKSVKIGQQVPHSLYQAAAEVLAYVYRLKRMQEG